MINVLVQFNHIIPSKMLVCLRLGGLWGAARLRSWPVMISGPIIKVKTIRMCFFHVPTVRAEQKQVY